MTTISDVFQIDKHLNTMTLRNPNITTGVIEKVLNFTHWNLFYLI